jgi:hypothetical protein
MKLLLTFCLCTLMLSAADRKTAQPAPPPKALEVPAGAVEFERSAYRYTDAQGARWIYYKTPFGVTRVADVPAPPKPVETYDDVKAVEDGNTIRFERPGPFGIYHWQRSKDQLNEMERAVWNRQHQAKPAAQE